MDKHFQATAESAHLIQHGSSTWVEKYLPGNLLVKYQTLVFTAFVWTFMEVLYCMASFAEAARRPAQMHLDSLLYNQLPGYICIVVISCVLALKIEKVPKSLLRPKGLLLVGACTLVFGNMLTISIEMLTTIFIFHHPINNFITYLVNREAYMYFTDCIELQLVYLVPAIYFIWLKSKSEQLQLAEQENEGLALSLRLLQGQLKPHFLFNALNSISALIRTADRELASVALEKLNALLRYVIHASKHEWSSVADEISFIKDYLDMQMLRYGERVSITWTMEEAAWHDMACPPLLFQPMVENAFRHGVEQHYEQCQIQLRLYQRDGAIIFSIESPLIHADRPNQGHGLGLPTTRDRLAILYAAEAGLHTEKTDKRFIASVKIPDRTLITSCVLSQTNKNICSSPVAMPPLLRAEP